MVAAVTVYAGENSAINALSGSGIAFFGDDGFGDSIAVGSWQGRSFISNGAGTTQGPEADNIKYLNAGSGILGQTGSGIALTAIPNQQATARFSLTNDTAVQTQNQKLYFYDRVLTSNAPTGVTVKACEIIHPTVAQDNDGSGDTVWITPAGTGVTLSLCPSPGISGLYAGNGNDGGWSDTQHDWYVGISVSPDSIGSKTQFGMLFEVEYY